MEKKRKPTIKQSRRIDKTIETGNATEAAAQVYNVKNRDVAKTIGSENMSKPYLKQEIEDRLRDAKNMIYTLAMTGGKEEVRLRASQDIVDRVEGKPIQKVEQSGTLGLLNFELTEQQKKIMAKKITEKYGDSSQK